MTNRNARFLAPIALLLACAGDPAEVETALRSYLSERTDLNLQALQVDIVDVNQSSDSASATAEFRTEAGAEPMLVMPYELNRVNGQWQV